MDPGAEVSTSRLSVRREEGVPPEGGKIGVSRTPPYSKFKYTFMNVYKILIKNDNDINNIFLYL